VRLPNNVGRKSFLIFFFKTQLDTSLNKAQHKQELLCGQIFDSGRNVYVIEEPLYFHSPLTKLNTNKSWYVDKYLALVGMCMSLRNLYIFIHLRSISKSRFSKINTKSDITPPNNLDMVTFEILLTWDFVSTKA
jgi:hypothetical protein